MRVLAMKTGCVAYMRDALGKMPPGGENGGPEGALRGLQALGHEVVFTGRLKGTLPDGVRHVDLPSQRLDDLSNEADLLECCGAAFDELCDWRPEAVINVCGSSATWSCPWNPLGIGLQTRSVRYLLPHLYLMGKRLPHLHRLCINGDVRAYPQEHEIVTMWPSLRPAAMLTCRTRDWSRRLRQQRFNCREVDCGYYNWSVRTVQEGLVLRTVPQVVIAHAHMTTGMLTPERDGIFRAILNHDRMRADGTLVFGEGWDKHSAYDPDLMPGAISPADVETTLAGCFTCPIVAVKDGWGQTSKLKAVVEQGCLPLIYGRGTECTYDQDYRRFPRDHVLRFETAGELDALTERFGHDSPERDELMAYCRSLIEPDYSVMGAMLDDYGNGMMSSHPATFYDRYGGYWPL